MQCSVSNLGKLYILKVELVLLTGVLNRGSELGNFRLNRFVNFRFLYTGFYCSLLLLEKFCSQAVLGLRLLWVNDGGFSFPFLAFNRVKNHSNWETNNSLNRRAPTSNVHFYPWSSVLLRCQIQILGYLLNLFVYLFIWPNFKNHFLWFLWAFIFDRASASQIVFGFGDLVFQKLKTT